MPMLSGGFPYIDASGDVLWRHTPSRLIILLLYVLLGMSSCNISKAHLYMI